MNKTQERISIAVLILLPFIGLIAGCIHLWYEGKFDFFYLWLGLAFYVFTGMGITVGYHRHFTHRSFDTFPFIRYILGIAGSMAFQGNVIEWCSRHADHHHSSDKEDDPHSPWKYGGGFIGIIKGFFHAQFVWMFNVPDPIENSCKKRLLSDPLVVLVNKYTLLWMVLSAVLPSVFGYLHDGVSGAYYAFIWAGLVRLFMLQHVTWAINSYCHLWGKKNWKSGDESRDSWLFGFLAFGEGFHNGHHAFQSSALHGIKYPLLDISFVFIRLLSIFGLAWDIRIPTQSEIERRKVPSG